MDDSLARGMAMVSTTSAGLASTKVFEDQNLLPLILNHLAAPIVERMVSGPVPDSLPNDHTEPVDIVKRLDVDVRRVKLRAALNTLPGLLRGMAALGAVCRGWRDHVSKGHVVAVQQLVGLPAKPSMLRLRADLLEVTRLRGALADLGTVAFTESVIERLSSYNPYDADNVELIQRCNALYDRIRSFTLGAGSVQVREFKLDVDDPKRVDPAKASRLMQLLYRREGLSLDLPAREGAVANGNPVNILTGEDDEDLVIIYSFNLDPFDKFFLVDGEMGIMLPTSYAHNFQTKERQDIPAMHLMPAAARDRGNTDIHEWDCTIEVWIMCTPVSEPGQSGITIEIQGWSRDYTEDSDDEFPAPYFSNEDPYSAVTLGLPSLDDVRVRFRDGRASLRNAEMAMAAPPNIA